MTCGDYDDILIFLHRLAPDVRLGSFPRGRAVVVVIVVGWSRQKGHGNHSEVVFTLCA